MGGGLLYVDQTGDAKHRLRDLPVGESHHLASTVPPETWERVVVVQWPNLLARISPAEAQAAERLGPATCGLTIEYLLQVAYRPVMNSRRRRTTGDWYARKVEASRSRGAIASTQLPEPFNAMRSHWDELASASADAAVIYTDAGRAAFPALL